MNDQSVPSQTRPVLEASPRTMTGKAVKQLRARGKLPAHVYGRGMQSQTISVDTGSFLALYQKTGETALIDLVLEETRRPVLVQNVQIDSVSDRPLHVDFYQVNLKEKVRLTVPIEIIGDSPAVQAKQAVLEQPIAELEIEALPTDIPESIQVDVSQLAAIDDAIFVKDLKVDTSRIAVLSDMETIVIKIGPLLTEEMQKALEEEIAAQAAQALVPSDTGPGAKETQVEEKGQVEEPTESTKEQPHEEVPEESPQ